MIFFSRHVDEFLLNDNTNLTDLIKRLNYIDLKTLGVEQENQDAVEFDKRLFYEGNYNLNTNSFENWSLPDYSADTIDQTKFIQLAHVTNNSDASLNKPINTFHALGKKEFGTGFYTVTGHDPAAPQTIAKVFSINNKRNLDKIIRFNIPEKILLRLFPKSDSDRAFLWHMLRHPTGYLDKMNEKNAIDIMNRVNVEGKVLLFPDNKDAQVNIDST